MVIEDPVFIERAAALGIYPISRAVSRMRCAVVSLMSDMPLIALLTVATDRPHCRAISFSVTIAFHIFLNRFRHYTPQNPFLSIKK